LEFYKGFNDESYRRLRFGRWVRLVQHMNAVKQHEMNEIERMRH
jgi:hypothetical protein